VQLEFLKRAMVETVPPRWSWRRRHSPWIVVESVTSMQVWAGWDGMSLNKANVSFSCKNLELKVKQTEQ